MEKCEALHLNKLDSSSPKDALCQVGWNLACGPGEEDENVTSLRQRQQQHQWQQGRWTTKI